MSIKNIKICLKQPTLCQCLVLVNNLPFYYSPHWVNISYLLLIMTTYLSNTAHIVSVSFIVDNLPFYYSPHCVSVFYC